MKRAGSTKEEAEATPGPNASAGGGESPSGNNGSAERDSPVLIGEEEEAAGDSSPIDVLYPEPSDSVTGGLFLGSASFDWSSPDSSGEGRNHEGGQESCEELASRPGNSRIPGKDHRRYYHSHWRLEYLMDFNARSHSMICMVCGSALATLKLSTIKRHIQQKHPYSLTWTLSEKEAIIGSWDAHLSVDAQTLTGGEEQGADDVTVSPGPKKKRRRLPSVVKGSWRPASEYEIPQPPPPDRTQIEQSMNESLKQWFRLEYLMDYDCLVNKLYCMICTTTLPSLGINDVKNHILDNHPTSVYFSPPQKGIIIETWINRKDIPVVDVDDEMDDDEEDDEEVDLTKSKMSDEEDESDKSVMESGSESKSAKENVGGKRKDVVDVPVSEKDSLGVIKPQQTEKKTEAGNLEEGKSAGKEKMEEEKRKAKDRPRTLCESEDIKNKAKTYEKQQECEDTAVLEGKSKPTESQLLVADKQKPTGISAEICKVKEEPETAKETSVPAGVRDMTREALLLQDKKRAADQLLLEEKLKAINAKLFQEEKRIAEAFKQLEKESCTASKVQLGAVTRINVKEVQTVLLGHQSVDQSIVKIEEEEAVEPVNMCIGKINVNTIKKEQEPFSCPKPPEDGKKLSIVRVQQVQPVPQTPGMLGIGVPLIKMENPTAPIIITRVSVLPEHTVVSQPQPSTSTSDVSKVLRIIAPKMLAPIAEPKPQKASPSPDPTQLSPAIDPVLWEVSLWQDNSDSSINNSQANAYQMRWRTEFLMDYNGLRGSVVCMYCCSSLTVLKESSIKRHIVQKHPHTSNFSAERKQTVILDWENKLAEVKKLVEQQTQDGILLGESGINVLKIPDYEMEDEEEDPEPNWAGVLSEGKSASWEFAFGRVQGKTPKDPRKYQHDRWKLEFLMDYTPSKDGLICMVCGVTLINPKITTVKMHIQQKHPDTIYLSDQEKAVVIEEWEQRLTAGKRGPASGSGTSQQDADEICIEINEDATTSQTNGSGAGTAAQRTEIILPMISKPSKPAAALPPPCNSAKRSYQVRWRTEFMMDYDCRRQGLICMVCGGTLATLKVSTIKRHIVQVHPYSVDFTPEERQRILEAYSEMALHYIHSEECFKAQPQEEVKGRKRKSAAVEV
ncbi:zinc finger translocation-associated protein [Gastrophryne carolinensis]